MRWSKAFCIPFFCLAALTSTVPAEGSERPAPLGDADFQTHSDAKALLGRALFYDPVLSGSYRVSCGTCHNHDRASSNGLPLRVDGSAAPDDAALPDMSRYQQLQPSARHAPSLFNLGHVSFTRLFSDGRVAIGTDGAFETPAGDALPSGLESVLAAQALFPAVTPDELVGTVDTELSARAHDGSRAIWAALAARVAELEGYRPLFERAFPQDHEEVTISKIANAIAAFVAVEWRANNSPYDGFLRGDANALSQAAKRGLTVFNGKGGCAACHSGALQTDQDFHAVATPLWPYTLEGDADAERFIDVLIGRANATGLAEDRFRFKTPSLRNISATAPYGHAGSHKTLSGFVDAHLNPEQGLGDFVQERFGDNPPVEISDLMSELLQRNQLKPVALSGQERSDLLAFLETLTDPSSLAGRFGKPQDVPSNLAID